MGALIVVKVPNWVPSFLSIRHLSFHALPVATVGLEDFGAQCVDAVLMLIPIPVPSQPYPVGMMRGFMHILILKTNFFKIKIKMFLY